jgi:hypothetical protein
MEKKNLQKIIVVQMYEILVMIQMHSQSNYYIYVCVCTLWEFFLRMNFNFFSFGQSIKKELVKIGYFCIKQMMIWDNVVMFPFH